MNKYKIHDNGIKYINFIDRLKLLFIKPMYLYSKEYNLTIKCKINKGKLYILNEIWGDSNE